MFDRHLCLSFDPICNPMLPSSDPVNSCSSASLTVDWNWQPQSTLILMSVSNVIVKQIATASRPPVHSFKSPPFLVAQVKRQITIDSTWCYQLNTSSFIPSHKVTWQRLMAPDSNDKARQVPRESATFLQFQFKSMKILQTEWLFLRNSNWISTCITWRATAHVRDKLG